jgi:hypothetical protein
MFSETLFSAGYWQAVFAGESSLSFLWDLFLQEHANTFVVLSLGLAFTISVIIVVYLLPRSNTKRLTAIGIALLVGASFLVQTVHTVSVPKMYADLGKGQMRSCPVLQKDAVGRLVYKPFKVMVDGKERIAMVAQKNAYILATNPVIAGYQDAEYLGMLLHSTNAFHQDFPVLCGVLMAEGGEEVLEYIKNFQAPVPIAEFVQFLKQNMSYAGLYLLHTGKIPIEGVAQKVADHFGDRLLPMTSVDLVFAFDQAVQKMNPDTPMEYIHDALETWAYFSDNKIISLGDSEVTAMAVNALQPEQYTQLMLGELSPAEAAELISNVVNQRVTTFEQLETSLRLALEQGRIEARDSLVERYAHGVDIRLYHYGWKNSSSNKVEGHIKKTVSLDDVLQMMDTYEVMPEHLASTAALFNQLSNSEKADLERALHLSLSYALGSLVEKTVNARRDDGTSYFSYKLQEIFEHYLEENLDAGETVEYLSTDKDVTPLVEKVFSILRKRGSDQADTKTLQKALLTVVEKAGSNEVVTFSNRVTSTLGAIDFSGRQPVILLPGEAPYYLLPEGSKMPGEKKEGEEKEGEQSEIAENMEELQDMSEDDLKKLENLSQPVLPYHSYKSPKDRYQK